MATASGRLSSSTRRPAARCRSASTRRWRSTATTAGDRVPRDRRRRRHGPPQHRAPARARRRRRDPGTERLDDGDDRDRARARAPGCAAAARPASPATATDPETCIAPTSDCGSAACADTQACVAGACVTTVPDPTVDEPPTGTGLFVSLVTLPDGRLAAAYYDETARALVLAVESAAGTSTFTEAMLDGGSDGDRGMWASAGGRGRRHGPRRVSGRARRPAHVHDVDGTGAAGTPEVVDDGERTGDRTHPVGAPRRSTSSTARRSSRTRTAWSPTSTSRRARAAAGR